MLGSPQEAHALLHTLPHSGTQIKVLLRRSLEFLPMQWYNRGDKKEELREWQHRSGLPLKRFFNTSGLQYKALGLKDRLPGMDEEEQLDLLAADGMLVKRPILAGEDFVLVGFKPAEWEARFGKSGGNG